LGGDGACPGAFRAVLEPGEQCGYHAATFGWLNGEVLRRITGMTAGAIIRAHITASLQADVFVGLFPAEMERTAEIIPPRLAENLFFRLALALIGRAKRLAFTNPPRPAKAANTTTNLN
jgi:CubicO group peptidase (beta-lactamase class C family)